MPLAPLTTPLQGICILITRPAAQGLAISALIRQQGGEVIAFPVIDIIPPADRGALREALNDLANIDLIIFVSVPSVQGVCAAWDGRLSIPPTTRVAAIGPATAAQCEDASIPVDFVARAPINSEGLLAEMRDLEVAGKSVLIFRGQSGREVLKDALERRGAVVRYAQAYRRRPTTRGISTRGISTRGIATLLGRWRSQEIHLVVIGSIAVMDALAAVLGDHQHLLRQTPVVAASQRVADYCRGWGVQEAHAAEQPTDHGMVAAICEWATQRPPA